MNGKLHACRRRLAAEIETAGESLAGVSRHLADAAESKVEGLEAHLEESVAKCEAKRDEAAGAAERWRHHLAQKKNEIVSRYEDWKTDRDIDKLEKHADKLEDRAVDAMVVAAFALLEAETATVLQPATAG